MKKIKSLFATIVISSLLFSCNDKLKIAAPYKNITVVYGMLNKADTAHYIRIQKAFMDENQSALEMAQIADSNFYQSLNVVVREINASGVVINTLPLNRVDLLAEGYPKATGAFFNTPNFAFKFKYALSSANTYRIVITNALSGNIDSVETPIIENNLPISQFGITEWLRTNETINFVNIYTPNGSFDEIDYSINLPRNVGAAEIIVRFNWTDSNIVTGEATYKYADFNGFNVSLNSAQTNGSASTQNKNIYDFLKGIMGAPANSNTYRYMDSCDAYLWVAGKEYKRYNDLNQNKGGLTADEIKPLYTNVKGANVMGLVSTRTSVSKMQIPISLGTQDSLQSNSITRSLNIRFYK